MVWNTNTARGLRAGLFTGILALAGAGAVSADPIYEQYPIQVRPSSVAVSFADLDLSTPEGALKLLRRIERAGETVCDYRHAPVSVRTMMVQRSCYRDAVNRAVSVVDAEEVDRMHTRRHRWAKSVDPSSLQMADMDEQGRLVLNR